MSGELIHTYRDAFPAGSTFARDSQGEVVMHWPGLYAGTNSQLVARWIEDNCQPGAWFDLFETGAGEIAAVHLRLPDDFDPAVELAEVDPEFPPAAARAFHLVRYDDVSCVSGTGVVANGAQMPDGHVALRWCVPGMPATWNLFDSVEDLLRLNGHNGLTVVKWVDGRD